MYIIFPYNHCKLAKLCVVDSHIAALDKIDGLIIDFHDIGAKV